MDKNNDEYLASIRLAGEKSSNLRPNAQNAYAIKISSLIDLHTLKTLNKLFNKLQNVFSEVDQSKAGSING